MSIKAEDEHKFINIVSRHPIVYNTAHTNYRNNLVKELAWKAIAKEIGKDVDECKKKWKCVRDGYNRFKKNRLMAGGPPNPKNSKKYRHNQLSFLDGLQNDTSMIDYPEIVYEEDLDQIEYKNVTLIEENGTDSDKNSDNETSHSEHELDNSDSNEAIKSVKNKPAKQKTLKSNPSTTRKDTEKHSNTEHRSRNTRSSDDVEYFSRYIAEVLRNLPPVVKARAKQHLNTVLSEYEIMAAQESTSSQDVRGTSEQESLPT